ncbi:MAG: phosphodiesterase [Eubacteriales bacterium]|nr:phosphodiesterase [Eubacteriales bacterium]
MNYFFASDIHGSAYWCEKMLAAYRESGAERLILLGDILYHGPRNDLPKGYAPKEVIAMLNPLADEIVCVRGNCEAEVDQMVLAFPCMADYALLHLNGLDFFATHGHLFNTLEDGRNLPPLKNGDILIHGHTHLPVAERFTVSAAGENGTAGKAAADKGAKQIFWLNPGSVSIPKGGNKNSFGLLSGKHFSIRDFDGSTMKEIELIV